MKRKKGLYVILSFMITLPILNVNASDLFIEDGSGIELIQEDEGFWQDAENSDDLIIDFQDNNEEINLEENMFMEETENEHAYENPEIIDEEYSEPDVIFEEKETETMEQSENIIETENTIEESSLEDISSQEANELVLDDGVVDILGTSEETSDSDSEAVVLTKSGILNKSKPTISELRAMYFAIPTYENEYDVVPNAKYPYSIGKVNDTCLQAGIGIFNLYRRVAGLDEVEGFRRSIL